MVRGTLREVSGFSRRSTIRHRGLKMQAQYDVIVIGGSFAGLSAATQLARARRRVLVIDAERPRNRYAKHAHGFLGHDGKPPEQIIGEARAQLLLYPTVDLVKGEATSARKLDQRFYVSLLDGRTECASRLVLATGVTDELPPIPGMQERWGVSVLHCPYCHGYEVRDYHLGVLANNAMSAHQALLLPDWGPTTLFTQGVFEPDEEQALYLAARNVRVERVPVTGLLGSSPKLEAVMLSDGRVVAIDALFTAPRTHLPGSLVEQLGCAIDAGPLGSCIRVNDWKETTIEGVYAAGDASSPISNATFASAAGVAAGVGAHQSLVTAKRY